MILGGTGSLTGMIVGAIVIIASNQALDSTSPPNHARVLFYAVLIAAVLLTLKSWPEAPRRARGRSSRSASSLHAIVGAVWSNGTQGEVTRAASSTA